MSAGPLVDAKDASDSLVRACVDLYPTVVRQVYMKKRPKLDIEEIIADDDWRYTVLPRTLKDAQGLDKGQLERLVKWKITHGQHRPFLPGMVAKNTAGEVKDSTTQAFKLVQVINTIDTSESNINNILDALKEVTKLKGIGPATGTLVLSVFRPACIPFFEDELFHWLCPEHTAKLKYDLKEYKMLLGEGLKKASQWHVEPPSLEKAAYVMLNADALTEQQKRDLELITKGDSTVPDALSPSAKTTPGNEAEPYVENAKGPKTATKRAVPSSNDSEHVHSVLRRSKRRKD